jgi:hypothetical protein
VSTKYLSPGCAKYICTLEKKPSEADYYIEEVEQVSPLLEKLYNSTRRKKKNRSYSDITVLQADATPLKTIRKAQKTLSIANLTNMNGGISINHRSPLDRFHSTIYEEEEDEQKSEMKILDK